VRLAKTGLNFEIPRGRTKRKEKGLISSWAQGLFNFVQPEPPTHTPLKVIIVTEEKKVQTTHPGQDGFCKHCQSPVTAARCGGRRDVTARARRRFGTTWSPAWPIEAASLPLHAMPRSSDRFFDLVALCETHGWRH
jgi:hypothetical protein